MQILDLGRKSYEDTWALQKELVEKRATGEIEDTLILVEHEPVYTVGRASTVVAADESAAIDHAIPQEIHVRKLGSVPVVEIERGGKMTFHGPGQLVGYPIFHLADHDLRRYLRDIERILMITLAEEALIEARPCPATLVLEPGQLQTGVWVQDRKIASIGIAVKKWVSYHGFALNLTTDLRYFEAISPCGFTGSIMTSVANELRADHLDLQAVCARVKDSLSQRFQAISLHAGDSRRSTDSSLVDGQI